MHGIGHLAEVSATEVDLVCEYGPVWQAVSWRRNCGRLHSGGHIVYSGGDIQYRVCTVEYRGMLTRGRKSTAIA